MYTPDSNLTTPQVKKPYAKPEIVYQQPLEALAFACTGSAGNKASAVFRSAHKVNFLTQFAGVVGRQPNG